MKKQQLRLLAGSSAAVALIVLARLIVSVGRLIFAAYTGMDITAGDPPLTWQQEIFGDGFFYVGLAALIVWIVARAKLKKT